jgi:short-subunit dehydrogenase
MKGSRIILTGASEGIGRALALALASRGARVALAARDRERLESLAQQCRAAGGEAFAVPTDVTSQQVSSGWWPKPSRPLAASTW